MKGKVTSFGPPGPSFGPPQGRRVHLERDALVFTSDLMLLHGILGKPAIRLDELELLVPTFLLRGLYLCGRGAGGCTRKAVATAALN